MMNPTVRSPRRHLSFIHPHSSFRRGVSLLEVLISIGVIMFGLLGVAAILPLGSRNVAEIVKSDNAAACGASALRDVRAWGILNPYAWRWPSFAASPSAVTQTLVQFNNTDYLPFGQSFAIDPLFVARTAPVVAAPDNSTATDPRPQYFPYDPGTPTRSYWLLPMPRTTIRLPNDPSGGGMTTSDWARHEAFYSRFFTWHDDPRILLPTEGTERPRQAFLCTDSEGRVLPKLATDPAVNPLPWNAQNQGDYTWMAIVTPSINEADVIWDSSGAASNASVPASRRIQYLVQIVVFYKRDFDVRANYLTGDEAPPERTVTANILSGGYGGGDVSLTTRVADGNYTHYLAARKNQWIMLCGQSVLRNPNDTTKTATINVYRWYRVVSASEPEVDATNTNYVRYVTLVGPDWNTDATAGWCYRGSDPAGAFVDLDGDGTVMDAAAVIADNVVGVYTMTFEIDRDTQAMMLGQ